MKARATLVLLFILAGMIALALFARRAADAAPTSDIAVIESDTLLASQGRLLLGPYSRFQWHHPGPLSFYWLAPFYAAAGHRTTGLNAGALALNAGCLALIAWILVRRAHPVVTIAVTSAAAVYAWRSAELLTSPWNPHIAVIPMMTLIVAAADAASGAPWMLPVVALLASFAGQTHVALLPSAVIVGACAVLGVIVGNDPRRMSAPLVATLAALALCWLPPVVEQLASPRGNIGLLWSFFARETHPRPLFAVAVSAWSDMLTGLVRPDFYVAHGWIFRESPVRWAELLSIVQFAALAVWLVAAYRARRRFELTLAAILVVAGLTALWSTTRVDGEIFDHGVFWISGLGVLNLALLAALAAGAGLKRQTVAAASSRWPAVAAVALTGIAAIAGVRQFRDAVAGASNPGADSGVVAAVAADLRTYLREQHIERPLIKLDQDAWGMAAGVILQLQKANVPLAVEDDWIVMFTPVFAATGHEAVTLTIAGRDQHVRMQGGADAKVAVAHDPIYVHVSR